MDFQKIIPGSFFHIYNRGINGVDLFINHDNYLYFLHLYEKYVEPVADTYAWCLMKNHFHFLVYIKKDNEIDLSQFSYRTIKTPKRINASSQFGHLFNAYCQAFNKRFKRSGSLFESPFERKQVYNESYFQKLVYYIHYNPVHHGFTKDVMDYPWSSYCTVLSQKKTKLKREELLKRFESVDNFRLYHSKKQNLDDIGDLMIDFPW